MHTATHNPLSPDAGAAPAVLAVTPNPAVDVTITVDALIDEATHRIDAAKRRLGGKGVNVAAVAASQGYPAFMLGPMNERSLAALSGRAEPLPESVVFAFTDSPVPLRETWAIHQESSGSTVIVNERGGAQPAGMYDAIASELGVLAGARPGSVVTVSGSWPQGAGDGALGLLVNAARGAGVADVIVDCAGQNLLQACELGAVVKPNAAELFETTGEKDPVAGARALVDRGASLAVVSLGPDGLVAADGREVVGARLTSPLSGNPTGAGDALVAALATGLLDGLDLSRLLVRACAWSAAAVLVPYAGAIDAGWRALAENVLLTAHPL